MSEKDDKPVSPWKSFNDAVRNKKEIKKPEQEKDLNVRDKDNAGLEYKVPNDEQQPRLNTAVPGGVGIRRNVRQPNQKMNQEEPREFVFRLENPNNYPIDMTTDDLTLDEPVGEFRRMVKQEPKPCPQGIDGGRISRLVLKKDGDAHVYFGHGVWIREPKTPAEHQAVDEIVEELNETPRKPFKRIDDVDHDPDNEI